MVIRRLLIGTGGVALTALVVLGVMFFSARTVSAAQIEALATDSADLAHYSGTVGAITGSNFTLTTATATVQISTSDKTWFLVQKNGQRTQGALSDLVAGDKVVVAGTGSANGGVDARLVVKGNLANFIQNHRGNAGVGAVGIGSQGNITITVKSVAGTTVNVSATGSKGQSRDYTLNTSASTVIYKNGFTSLSAIQPGDQVYVIRGVGNVHGARQQIRAQGNSDQAVAAIVVKSGDDAAAVGVVQATSSSAIQLGASGQVTATLSSATVYKQVSAAGQALATASLSDVKQGSLVLVLGSKVAGQGKTVAANAVVVLPAQVKAALINRSKQHRANK